MQEVGSKSVFENNSSCVFWHFGEQLVEVQFVRSSCIGVIGGIRGPTLSDDSSDG